MNLQEKAIFYRKLATLFEAGIPPDLCIEKLKEDPSINKLNLTQIKQHLEKGQSLSSALAKLGVNNIYENEMLRVSEEAGTTSIALKALASEKEDQYKDFKNTKSKFLLPFIILMMAIALQALLSLLKGADLVDTLFSSLAFVIVTIFITKKLSGIFQKDKLQRVEILKLVKKSRLFELSYQDLVLNSLYWQLKSGVAPDRAFQNTAKIFKSSELRLPLLACSKSCKSGRQISEAIKDNDLPLAKDALATLRTAETSGRLDSALEHFLSINTEHLQIINSSLRDWIPRLYYLVVIILVLPVIIQ